MTRNPKVVNYAAKTGNAPKWRGKDRPVSDDLVKRLRRFATDGDGWKEVSSDARPDLHDAATRIEALERLDQEYGQLEVAIIMADPEFDGDSDHTDCGARLIASVERIKARADADRARLAKAVEALRLVEAWNAFPETGETWPSGRAVSYATKYGSNGERDFMRSVARATLAEIGGA